VPKPKDNNDQVFSSIFKYFLKSPKKRIIRVCLNRIESMSLLCIFSLFKKTIIGIIFFLLFCFSYRFFLLLWLFFIFSFFLFLYYYNLYIIFIFFHFPFLSILKKNHIVTLVAIAYCIIISYAHHANNAYNFFLVFFCFGLRAAVKRKSKKKKEKKKKNKREGNGI
jgi:hypothetical protein